MWALISLACFPIVDYVLRLLPIVGSIWDKLILLGLALIAVYRFVAGDRFERLPYHRVMIAFLALGAAYVAIDLPFFAADFEGFRAVYWYMLFVFVLPFVVRERETALQLVRFSLYAGLLISLHGIYQYIVKTPIPPNWIDAGESLRTRAFSLFGSPNIMGSYMILLFPTAVGMAWSASSWRQRILFGGIALAAMMALLFTFTRGAWLALFVALVITAALIDRRLLILILVAAVAAFFIPKIHTRVTQLFDPLYWMKAAKDGRVYRWLLAYDVVRNNPFFGTGLGHFGGAVAARRFNAMYVDNYYAKTIGEMGLVGLFAMLALFWTVMQNLYKRIFKPLRSRPNWPLLAGMFAGLLALLVQNAVENVFEVPAMNFLFWFYVSLLVILTRTGDTHTVDTSLTREEYTT
ncbi:O-antigen ligase family protein [Effusibacillus dendaii]|uniref:Membrane protein n=1 Tax=Effusibacillus dendaii TaxID=2743772 RepID=A0A7I8DCE1_9BACL|nr:O-antigen ligase family protein [Effusibacillus dendaii]BCJ87755.1 membrane protein [Effusibacillus dendaii]